VGAFRPLIFVFETAAAAQIALFLEWRETPRAAPEAYCKVSSREWCGAVILCCFWLLFLAVHTGVVSASKATTLLTES
jgi:hypothetical protein